MKISIITATYNSESTMRDTIESVLGQTWKDIEYIVVDGASTDGTKALVESYMERFDGKLKFVSEPDKGIYDAMNKGLARATGDVVGVLNSDDFYTSATVLERVAAAMEHGDMDAVYGDVHYVNPIDMNRCVRYFSAKHFRKGQMHLGYIPPHPSFYCRTAVIRKCEPFNLTYKFSADFDLILRLLCKHGIKATYLPMDFVTMRVGGVTSSGCKSYKAGVLDHYHSLRANKMFASYLLLFFGLGMKAFGLMWGGLFGWPQTNGGNALWFKANK